jgi:hypothetical protein
MDWILQVWGGSFYLLNKVLFSLAEGRRAERQRRLRIAGWVIYILGVPAWVIILIGKHDWIAASIEAGGLPAMLFGLYNVYFNPEKPNSAFNLIAKLCTYSFLFFGVIYSLFDFGGVRAWSQVLEIGVMVGFLLGSFLLAQKKIYGWVFFMLMNISMASLMFLQNKPFLSFQQLISLCFVIYGFVRALEASRSTVA